MAGPMTWMISSDSHIVEPPGLFVERIDRAYRDHAPRVVEADGADWWLVDGEVAFSASASARAGDRFESQEGLQAKFRFDVVRPGAYQPDAWIDDNEADGVWGGVLYPSLGLVFFSIADGGLLTAVCRVWNDWVAEFAGAHPDRLKGVAMINLDDVDEAVAEMTRARARGIVGAAIPVAPPPDRPYRSQEYDRFWAAAQDLGIPLSLHIATNRTPGEWKQLFLDSVAATPDMWVRHSLADMIMSGVFERFPRLTVGSIEHEAGWAPFFVRRLDYMYTQMERSPDAHRFAGGALPSDFFHRNVFVSFQEDDVGVRERDIIGVDGLMWGNDYPHTESTFPRSRAIIADRLRGVPDDEKLKLLLINVARVYGFGEPA